MSSVQRFVYWLLPAWLAKDMEKESRLWMLRCNTCGSEKSVWEIGGIRYKAAGGPFKVGYCRGCQRLRWLKCYYKG
jgi:hypothetical protein